MENRLDTVSKLTKEDELIVRTLNVGTAWIPKMVGIELIHLPTKTVIRCTSSDNQHANMQKAREMLDKELARLGSNVSFSEDNPDFGYFVYEDPKPNRAR